MSYRSDAVLLALVLVAVRNLVRAFRLLHVRTRVAFLALHDVDVHPLQRPPTLRSAPAPNAP